MLKLSEALQATAYLVCVMNVDGNHNKARLQSKFSL